MKERSTRCPPKLRILSAILAFSMLLTLLPVTAFAAIETRKEIDGLKYVQVNNYQVLWITGTYTGNATHLTLENRIGGLNVNRIYGYEGDSLFKNNQTLKRVTLPANDYFYEIGAEAFAGCTNLETVDAPTTLGDVGKRAFQGCTALKSLALGSNSAHIYESAFEGCTSLESIQITGTVVYIEGTAFKGCTYLTSVTLPKYLKKMGDNAFEGCTSLEEITLPKEIESFGDNVFAGCDNLQKIIYNGKATDWANCPAKGKIPEGVKVEFAVPLTEYGISVCGTTVDETNTSDVLGDKKVEYTPDTNSLRLDSVNLIYDNATTAAIDDSDPTRNELTIMGVGYSNDTVENTSGPGIRTTGKLDIQSTHIVVKGKPAISAPSITMSTYNRWYRTSPNGTFVKYKEGVVDVGTTDYFEVIRSSLDPNGTGILLWINGDRIPEIEDGDYHYVFDDETALLERWYENEYTLTLDNANIVSNDIAIKTMLEQLILKGTGTITGQTGSLCSDYSDDIFYPVEVGIRNADLTFTGGIKLLGVGDLEIINSTVKINGWTEHGINTNNDIILDGSDVTIQDTSRTGQYALHLAYDDLVVKENSTLRLQGATSINDSNRGTCKVKAEKYWYRTSPNDAYTQGTEKEFYLDPSYTYYELTTKDPYAVKTYDLWVAGTQVTETNQGDVLDDDGSVKFDPTTNTLTLNHANLTPDVDADFTYWIDSDLTEELTITGTATLSNAEGILTTGPLKLDSADLTLTGDNDEEDGGGEDAIRAGSSDKDITIQNSKVTIAGTSAGKNFFQFGIRCYKLTVANSRLDVKANSGSAIAADTMEVSGADTVVTAETDSTDDGDYALALDDETLLTLNDGLALVSGKVNESKTAKIAQPEQIPDPTGPLAYWVVRPGDEPAATMQIPGAIVTNEEEAHLFAGWFLEDGTRLEDSPYYMGPDAGYVGNLDRDVIFHGRWCAPDALRTLTFEDCTVTVNGSLEMGYAANTSPVQLAPGSRVTLTLDESKTIDGMVFNGFVVDPIPADLTASGSTATFTMPDENTTVTVNFRTESEGGSDDFGTILAGGAVVGVAGVVAYQVGTELILDQLLPEGVAVPRTRAELAMLLWNTAGRPAPAAAPAFADVADPDLANAAQWAIEQGYLKARTDGNFKPEKGVAKWRVIRGYQAVAQQ